ncbi:hypothetical protein [Flavilitoribacter nigricans]|uniref:Lipocalin-like domain-containing protein n=1 Tax=Flavilitoribacter nigricans (strain ATCC 23147 / DSM 23189 / NBRC 102662 / NCIMB 1420 / SS-2) TaxID=1122177 RepID=A0A2D0MYR0_FLAN2|nr:hypothetical protein [Flavilitoribacter nigricans]PHN01422.1 hypothetical protein CRP01_37180 [Flavilitoribacter nigricans DSM 23189 = NBRC 102662]
MKTQSILGLFLMAAVLLSPACEFFKPDNLPPPDCEIGTPFWLWYDQSTDCETLDITFTGEIQDSRCPTTVDCIWAGRVDIQLEVEGNLITLGLPNDEQLGLSKAVVGDQEIELLDVFPAPIGTTEIPDESYRVKLIVRNL